MVKFLFALFVAIPIFLLSIEGLSYQMMENPSSGMPSQSYFPNFSGAPADNNMNEIAAIMQRIGQLQGFMDSTSNVNSANPMQTMSYGGGAGNSWAGPLSAYGSMAFPQSMCQMSMMAGSCNLQSPSLPIVPRTAY